MKQKLLSEEPIKTGKSRQRTTKFQKDNYY